MKGYSVECESILLDKTDDYRIPDEQRYIFTGFRQEN